jgi:MoaA/NifB/PqqE/SkfB family radical SAM enzyme
MALSRLLLRLASRGLRYRWLRATGRPALPEALSIEVTRRCIARCVMCNIWRTPPGPELAARDWLELLASPVLRELRELDVTGGEPFLREDLVELLQGVAELKSRHLTRLRSVAITTNGLLTRKVLRDVGAVVAPLERAGVALVFACGMDAAGEVHDRIRGYPGAWSRLDATIAGLVALRAAHPTLVLGVKTTVTRYNVAELDRICQYAEGHGLFTIISPYILTSNRYANLDREDALALSPADREELRRFYGSPRFRWSVHRQELLRFLETGRMEKPCSAGMNYFFIRSSGDLFPCPIAGTAPLGNVKQAPLEEILGSSAAARFRRRVGALPECATCTEPGLERYALPFEGFHYMCQYLREGRAGFLTLHRHLGLDKYLG